MNPDLPVFVPYPAGIASIVALAMACTSATTPEVRGTGGMLATGGTTMLAATGGTATVTGSGGTTTSSGGSTNSGSTATLTGSGGTATSSGGTKNSGGTTTSSGGSTNSGGTSTVTGSGGATMSSGGTKSTGGTATTTSSNTGGVVAAGGTTASTVPTGLPASCGTTVACNGATTVNPQLTAYGALGNVTMYSTNASSGGACLYGDTKVMYFAAINVNLVPGDAQGQWQGGRICGQCMEVTILTSQGPKQVVVRIMDKCPDGYCGIDLGGSAPAAVMVEGFGRYQGAWRAVSCAGHPEVSDGAPTLFIKDGSSAGWAVIQVRNPVMAVSAIDYQNSSSTAMKGTLAPANGIENYFSIPIEVLQANATIDLTVRYADGTTATASLTSAQLGIALGSYPLQ